MGNSDDINPEYEEDGGIRLETGRKVYNVYWPMACLGCGLNIPAMLEGIEVDYNKGQVGAGPIPISGQQRLYLCKPCTSIAKKEQEITRDSRVVSFIVSLVLIFPFSFFYANVTDPPASIAFFLFFLIWVPIIFGVRVSYLRMLTPHNSYFDIGVDTKRTMKFGFRNEEYFSKFRQMNPTLVSTLESKIRFGFKGPGQIGGLFLVFAMSCIGLGGMILVGFIVWEIIAGGMDTIVMLILLIFGITSPNLEFTGVAIIPFIYVTIFVVAFLVERRVAIVLEERRMQIDQ